MTASTLTRAPLDRPSPPGQAVSDSRPPGSGGTPGPGVEVAYAVLLLVSAAGFDRVFQGHSWIGPVLLTATASLAVAATTRRLVAGAVGMAVDVVVTALVTIWTVVPRSTVWGLPLGATWRHVGRALGAVGGQFAATLPPAPATTGFLLLAAAGVGLAGLLGSWTAFRGGRPGWAGLAPLAVFCCCCVLGDAAGAELGTAIEVGALGAYLLVERSSSTRQPGAGAPPRAVGTGVRLLVLAALAGVVGTAVVPGPDGRGALGWKGHTGGRTRIIISPMVSLSTRLSPQQSGTKVFTVHSPVPAYWQLTTLDVYSGDTWQAGRASYDSFSERLPGDGSPVPRDARQVRQRVHVQTLDSPWLPVAFTPVAVTGATDVQYNAATGSLLSKRPTSDGMNYTVTADEDLATLDPAELAAAPKPVLDQEPAGSLALPAGVPSSVTRLARRIVAGATSEYAEAKDLQDWFYGPQFTYSLTPPQDGSGESALTTFLFDTRTGYCQQFAGAFAVMARSLGLPTRLAIGFTTGTAIGRDSYQVTDADAHTWPEVWFPEYGWVPFEPTKGSPGHGFSIPGATRYTGNTAALANEHPASGPATTPSTAPSTSGQQQPSLGTGTGRNAVGAGRIRPVPVLGPSERRDRRSPGVPALAPSSSSTEAAVGAATALLVVVGAAVALLLANVVGRRVRRGRHRRTRAAGGRDAALVAWEEAAEALAGAGVRRRAAETRREFALRAATTLGWPSGDLLRLAEAVDAAVWSAGLPDRDVDADALRRVVTGAHRQIGLGRRLALAVDPRAAWAPVLVDGSAALPSRPRRAVGGIRLLLGRLDEFLGRRSGGPGGL